MAHALTHSSDSHSRALRLNRSQSFRGHSSSAVFNLYADSVFFALNSNQRGLASGVAMNVGQAFLHQAEYDDFHFGWESSEIIGNLQINLKTAALRKTLHVPVQRGRNTGFIQQRWMQKIGSSTQFSRQVLDQLFGVLHFVDKSRIFLRLVADSCKLQAQRGQCLSRAIV